jgi:hypothetical protein
MQSMATAEEQQQAIMIDLLERRAAALQRINDCERERLELDGSLRPYCVRRLGTTGAKACAAREQERDAPRQRWSGAHGDL